MEIQLVRHATLLLTINDQLLLVDPMLSPAGAMPPIVNSTNERRNPLVPIMNPQNFLQKIDAVLLTHTHRDHFDDTAAQLVPKGMLMFCQPEDEIKLQTEGFSKIIPVHKEYQWEGINLIRTEGQHGTGEIGKKMSPVSGYILQAKGEPLLYIAGDTIYCPEVERTLKTYHPHITVVNAGAAQFSTGDPITMTAQDVEALCQYDRKTTVVAVHMEAINHCLLSREELKSYAASAGLAERIVIPEDGETFIFTA